MDDASRESGTDDPLTEWPEAREYMRLLITQVVDGSIKAAIRALATFDLVIERLEQVIAGSCFACEWGPSPCPRGGDRSERCVSMRAISFDSWLERRARKDGVDRMDESSKERLVEYARQVVAESCFVCRRGPSTCEPDRSGSGACVSLMPISFESWLERCEREDVVEDSVEEVGG